MKIFISSDMEGAAGVVNWDRPAVLASGTRCGGQAVARGSPPDLAEMATWLERVEPDEHDQTVVHLKTTTSWLLYRTFIALVTVTRGFAG
jgi:hypothetical protein